jgi:hypothetical protein
MTMTLNCKLRRPYALCHITFVNGRDATQFRYRSGQLRQLIGRALQTSGMLGEKRLKNAHAHTGPAAGNSHLASLLPRDRP